MTGNRLILNKTGPSFLEYLQSFRCLSDCIQAQMTVHFEERQNRRDINNNDPDPAATVCRA